MRILRICVLALFVASALAFSFFFVRAQSKKENAYPTIDTDEGVLEISVTEGEEALLRDVTAADQEDGDLTDHVVIESVSNFLTLGECNVRYAVCDSSNNVTKIERRVRYTDYTSPKFYLKSSLCFSTLESQDIRAQIGVTDVIDGDISDNVIISSSDYVADEAGVYHVTVEATNSKGDTIETTLPVYTENRGYSAPVIRLQKYLTYMKVGETLDYKSLVSGVVDFDGEVLDNVKLSYDSGLRTSAPGVYTIHYYADVIGEDGTIDKDSRGHAVLIVIVEE